MGFVSNLKEFLFRRCRRFSPNFNIFGLVVKELHLLEVEGVELSIFFLNISKVIISPKAQLLIKKIKTYKIL
jgi:hypothetical protein